MQKTKPVRKGFHCSELGIKTIDVILEGGCGCCYMYLYDKRKRTRGRRRASIGFCLGRVDVDLAPPIRNLEAESTLWSHQVGQVRVWLPWALPFPSNDTMAFRLCSLPQTQATCSCFSSVFFSRRR